MSASILTNVGAMTALQTLSRTNSDLAVTQDRISTGMRVAKAKDNAAYWAIATTMRTDQVGYSAISDALGLGQATADIASEGATAIMDIMKEMKQRLVAAQDAGVDKDKINDDIQQLKAQIGTVIASASFNGNNWLDGTLDGTPVEILGSLVRTGATVTPQNISVDTADANLATEAAMAAVIGTYDNTTGTLDITAGIVIDNTSTAVDLATALDQVEASIARVTFAASKLGSVEKRLDIQRDFVSKLSDAVERGVGVLVDADMNRESARLQALQVQQQLGIQALSIANAAPQNILALFR